MINYKLNISIRDKDIGGNKIDTEKELETIIKEIAKFWNVEVINYSKGGDKL